jgi:hypothetical protein
LQHETYLVGLVNGHFDLWSQIRLIGDLPLEAGTIEAQVNSGVGVVTPVQMIEETYEMEELVEDRQRLEEREGGRLGEGQPLDRVAGAEEE